MLITANFATHKARRRTIDKAVASIINQVDIVRVYYNDYTPDKRGWVQYTGKDLTDKGKFYGIEKGEIAFTCDDDILYPPDYVDYTLDNFVSPVVTYHGRKLRGKGLNYYRDHESFHFLLPLSENTIVDVPGTGVMAFDTTEIMPDILSYKQDKMCDLLMALECKGVEITCLKHNYKWFSILTNSDSIYAEMVGNCDEQSRLADKLV